MKNLLKNKIIFIFLLSLVCFFSICVTNVNATDITYNDLTFTLPEGFNANNYLIYSTDKYNEYYLCYALEEDTYWGFQLSGSNYHLRCYTDNNSFGSDHNCINYGIYWMSRDSGTDFNNARNREDMSWIVPTDTSIGLGQEDLIIYSTSDIYNTDGTVFFQGTPQVISQVATMEITQVEALPMAIIQIVEIILPVFLIVFGVLLVLYLIKSKNLLNL